MTACTTELVALPPLPPGDYGRPLKSHRDVPIPFWNAPPGYCRWCGQDIGARTKSGTVSKAVRWHPQCSDEWTWRQPANQRKSTWREALGECAECGRFCPESNTLRPEFTWDDVYRDRQAWGGANVPLWKHFYHPWEADHAVPLIAGGTHDPENLQLLCWPCHKQKTGTEAATRRSLHLDDALWHSTIGLAARTKMSVSDLATLALRRLLADVA